MALKRLMTPTKLDAAAAARLLSGLVGELRRPDETETPPGAPTIYMEGSGTPDNYTHWYAVWDEFAGVDSEERSRLVLAAVREVFGGAETLRVTIAMGLTPDEATGMGL